MKNVDKFIKEFNKKYEKKLLYLRNEFIDLMFSEGIFNTIPINIHETEYKTYQENADNLIINCFINKSTTKEVFYVNVRKAVSKINSLLRPIKKTREKIFVNYLNELFSIAEKELEQKFFFFTKKEYKKLYLVNKQHITNAEYIQELINTKKSKQGSLIKKIVDLDAFLQSKIEPIPQENAIYINLINHLVFNNGYINSLKDIDLYYDSIFLIEEDKNSFLEQIKDQGFLFSMSIMHQDNGGVAHLFSAFPRIFHSLHVGKTSSKNLLNEPTKSLNKFLYYGDSSDLPKDIYVFTNIGRIIPANLSSSIQYYSNVAQRPYFYSKSNIFLYNNFILIRNISNYINKEILVNNKDRPIYIIRKDTDGSVSIDLHKKHFILHTRNKSIGSRKAIRNIFITSNGFFLEEFNVNRTNFVTKPLSLIF